MANLEKLSDSLDVWLDGADGVTINGNSNTVSISTSGASSKVNISTAVSGSEVNIDTNKLSLDGRNDSNLTMTANSSSAKTLNLAW